MLRHLITSGLAGLLSLQDFSEFEDLIASLGSESVEVREKSQERLIELGLRALPALRRAAADADLEVRLRARSAIDEIERFERERQHDLKERERLLSERRDDRSKQEEKEPGALFTGGTRFTFSVRFFQKGLVLHTSPWNYLYPTRTEKPISFDVVEVQDKNGKTLELERCGRCSPNRILVKNTSGPLRVHIKGTHLWFSPYPIEFKEPKNGDQKKIGDFTLRVDWPLIKVSCRKGWPKEVMEKVGNSFKFEVKEGVTGLGSGRYSSRLGGKRNVVAQNQKWWCSCNDGPAPVVEKPKPELVQMIDATGGGNEYSLDQIKLITYTFYKPVEEAIDFTTEVPNQ